MGSRKPKNVFIEEIAQINSIHQGHVIDDRDESFAIGKDMPITFVNRSGANEIIEIAKNILLINVHILCPFELFHLESLNEKMSSIYSQSITNKNIKNKLKFG